jgi:hypothetical protein
VGRRGIREDWIDFAAFAMLLLGSLDFFEGLIAIVREGYYTFSPNEVIVVDLTTWGWILVFWGSAVALIGVALWSRSPVARWLAVAIGSANIVMELGFAGGNDFPLWSLAIIALNILILYALIVRWPDAANDNA